jgi:3-oxoacyl-[acyl-carrier-protein] synthase-1
MLTKIDNKVYITATSSATCAGNNNQELFNSVIKGISGIRQDSNYFLGASPAIGTLKTRDDFYDVLITQCRNILETSSLNDFSDTLLIIGSSVGGMAKTEEIYFKTGSYEQIDPKYHNIQTIATVLNSTFNFYDDISFSTACTSSSNAIGYAYEVLSQGLYKNALVVGADSLSKTTVGGFLSLGVLSSEAAKPFDISREGMNVAEGIACLLLESEAKESSVEVCGVGYSSDAYHMTHPNAEGLGAKSAMKRALLSAGIEAEKIDYINAHGTGTKANDNAEAQAIASLFGMDPYVSSTKSVTGHTLGASGALEAIISMMIIEEGILPKNLFLDKAENREISLLKESKKHKVEYILSNAFAFGGNNCSLIFGKVK